MHCIPFPHPTEFTKIIILLLLLSVFLTACSTRTFVHQNQYVLQSNDNSKVARVYFLRPTPMKYKGIADSVVHVDFNGSRLLSVNEGRYALIKLKSSQGPITTYSLTMFTNQDQPIQVKRTRQYRFIAGKTYFIHLKRINEEFRGIFYDPAPITLEQAQKLAAKLRPYGDASSASIKTLEAIDESQLASPLEPVMPEQLYPGHKYLIKETPTYNAPQPPTQNKSEISFDQPPDEPIIIKNQ
ncbi:MAG: hypothetical protein GXP08_08030 [Gammaproteobacteria bacterium]|nr:hypothetical protein [Gammaproteobacteria bacterium]